MAKLKAYSVATTGKTVLSLSVAPQLMPNGPIRLIGSESRAA